MRRENNRWLGWKRITKMAAGAFGRARNYGKTASVQVKILVVNVWTLCFVFSIITGHRVTQYGQWATASQSVRRIKTSCGNLTRSGEIVTNCLRQRNKSVAASGTLHFYFYFPIGWKGPEHNTRVSSSSLLIFFFDSGKGFSICHKSKFREV